MHNQILLVLITIISICGAIIAILDVSRTIDILIKKRKKPNDYKDNSEDRDYKNDIDPKLVEILLKEDSISSIDKLLDQCIKDAGDIYNIMVLAPNQLMNNYSYISDKEQQRMSEYIYQNIMKTRINETLKKMIGLTYKIDTEEELQNLIKLRIKLYMLNFINSYNGLQES